MKQPQLSVQSLPPSRPPPDTISEQSEHTKQAGRERKQQAQRRSSLPCRNRPFQGQVKAVTRLTSSKAAELQVPSPACNTATVKPVIGSGASQDQNQIITLNAVLECNPSEYRLVHRSQWNPFQWLLSVFQTDILVCCFQSN